MEHMFQLKTELFSESICILKYYCNIINTWLLTKKLLGLGRWLDGHPDVLDFFIRPLRTCRCVDWRTSDGHVCLRSRRLSNHAHVDGFRRRLRLVHPHLDSGFFRLWRMNGFELLLDGCLFISRFRFVDDWFWSFYRFRQLKLQLAGCDGSRLRIVRTSALDRLDPHWID